MQRYSHESINGPTTNAPRAEALERWLRAKPFAQYPLERRYLERQARACALYARGHRGAQSNTPDGRTKLSAFEPFPVDSVAEEQWYGSRGHAGPLVGLQAVNV